VYFKKLKPGLFAEKGRLNKKDTKGHEGRDHEGKKHISSFVKLCDLGVLCGKTLSTPSRVPVLSEFGGYSLNVDEHL